MIELSFGKLLVLALIALIVLGPEKLPGAARTAGALVRRLRNGWDSVRSEVERELEIEEIRRTAREAASQAESAKAQMNDAVKQVNDMARGMSDTVQREADEIATQIKEATAANGLDDPLEGLATDAPQQMSGPQPTAVAMERDERPYTDAPLDEVSEHDDEHATADLFDDHPDAAGTLRRAPYGQKLRRRAAGSSTDANGPLDGDTPSDEAPAPNRSGHSHGDA